MRSSKLFWSGVFLFIFLLWAMGDTFQWRTHLTLSRGAAKSPARVLLDMGVIEVQWREEPVWHAKEPPPPGGVEMDRWLKYNRRVVWSSFVWYPPLYDQTSNHVRETRRGPDLRFTVLRGRIYDHRVRIPIWMLITLQVGLWWILLWFHRRRCHAATFAPQDEGGIDPR